MKIPLQQRAFQEKKLCWFVEVNEKHKTANLTEIGTEKAVKTFWLVNLSDPVNMEVAHQGINQALKANNTMQRDADYVVSVDDREKF